MKLTTGIPALLLALTMAATPVSASIPDLTTAHSLDELQLLSAPLTLEELTAEMLGKEAGLFLASGTQSNLVGHPLRVDQSMPLRCWA